jgi:hypothetical protein
MNEHDDVMCLVRESFSGLRMDMTVEQVFAASRVRRRRRLSGLTAATAATAGAAAAITLTMGGTAPARSGTPPPPSPRPVTLAAYAVTSGPGGSTTLMITKGVQVDPNALREDLARHGIPALVTVGTFCRSVPGASADFSKILQASSQDDGQAMVIDGQAIPPGTRLSIGLFPNYTRMLVIKDGAPLSCSSTSDQPAVHIPPAGTPIRG